MPETIEELKKKIALYEQNGAGTRIFKVTII